MKKLTKKNVTVGELERLWQGPNWEAHGPDRIVSENHAYKAKMDTFPTLKATYDALEDE